MATSLFSTVGETHHLHRLITRLALIGAAASALVLVGASAVTGTSSFGLEAIGPALTALLLLPMVILRRENAAATLALATASVVITFKLVGSPDTTVAATTAVVVMASLSVLFLSRHIALSVLAGMVALSMVPLFWGTRLEGGLATGLVMSLSFLVGATTFTLIRRAAAEVNSRYRLAFEDAPVALLELDWTEARSHLARRGIAEVQEALTDDPGLIVELVARTRAVRANAEAARLFGVAKPADLLGLIGVRFAQGPLGMWFQEQFVAIGEGRLETTIEVSLSDWGIDRWVSVRTISSMPSSGVGTSILAMTDLTVERLHERSLNELIESKNEFIATVSHELRTPLTAVVGLTSELATSSHLDERERRELLEVVAGQSREISYIVEDLLVGARAEIGAVSVVLEPFDLLAAARGVDEELAAALDFSSDPQPVLAFGDTIRVRQIIRNLVINASRYGGIDRRVVVSVDGSRARLDVRDSGPAIPVEDRERIFEPYERAHDRIGRTMAMGLGLSVSRRLARMMDGDLVYFHDGESVFCLTLPLAFEGAEDAVETAVVSSG
ncbi:MAG: HAMP domain-containing histidine kinase [Acidimicrobiia bacterium]|nr:HAMP domain-containing histidine kinase [Acidimicrobiia bacterium]